MRAREAVNPFFLAMFLTSLPPMLAPADELDVLRSSNGFEAKHGRLNPKDWPPPLHFAYRVLKIAMLTIEANIVVNYARFQRDYINHRIILELQETTSTAVP